MIDPQFENPFDDIRDDLQLAGKEPKANRPSAHLLNAVKKLTEEVERLSNERQ